MKRELFSLDELLEGTYVMYVYFASEFSAWKEYVKEDDNPENEDG